MGHFIIIPDIGTKRVMFYIKYKNLQHMSDSELFQVASITIDHVKSFQHVIIVTQSRSESVLNTRDLAGVGPVLARTNLNQSNTCLMPYV